MVDTSPETWRWIWLVAALFFLGGEMVVPGTFFLLPFGISAGVAVVLAFIGVAVWVQFVVWLVLGTAMFAWFFRWSKRYAGENETPIGVGADRLLGEIGPVIATIPAGPPQSGRVRLGAEMWNASELRARIIEDQNRRRLINEAHGIGRLFHGFGQWPQFDAGLGRHETVGQAIEQALCVRI